MFGLLPPQRSTQSTTPTQRQGAGMTIELRSNGSHVQWRYKGIDKWMNIIAIQDLKGEAGKNGSNGSNGIDGAPGATGEPGTPGAEGPQGEPGEQGIQGIQGNQGPRGMQGAPGIPGLDGMDGKPGTDGREIELQKTDTHIQWRLVGDVRWKNIIALADLKGPKGDRGENGEQGERGQTGEPGADGTRGPQGYTGAPGTRGAPGVGVPAGGTTGQVLAKVNGTDYNTEWITPPYTLETGLPTVGYDGQLVLNAADSTLYFWLNGQWNAITGGSVTVDGVYLLENGDYLITEAGDYLATE